jgi:ABC-type microcin C transport system permease subunit YejE
MLADLIKATLTFVMSNYSLSVFVLGLIVSLVAIARSGTSIDRPLVVKKPLAWYVFFVSANFCAPSEAHCSDA